MKKPNIRALACLLAVMLCMMVFSFSAMAEAGEYDEGEIEESSINEYDEEVSEESEEEISEAEPAEEEPVEESAVEPPVQEEPEPEEVTGGIDEATLDDLLGGMLSAFTPEGNLSLIDDFTFTGLDADGNEIQKQFITVQSKNGNYFYIIIDRVGESQNVYFLNMVDEADLMALLETGEEAEPEVCTCEDKCYAGHVDTDCPICAKDMTLCVGKEPEPEPEPEPEIPEEPQKQNSTGALLGIVLLLALAGGAAFYILKVRGGRSKPKTKGDTDLDNYDYGTDDDEYTEFEPYEESDMGGSD